MREVGLGVGEGEENDVDVAWRCLRPLVEAVMAEGSGRDGCSVVKISDPMPALRPIGTRELPE